jgi:hypothetical protein
MIARHLAWLAVLMGASACLVNRNCDENQPIAVGGTYEFEADPDSSEDAPSDIVSATLEASAQEVVVEYARGDGSRWKATYRVTERRIDQ